MTSLLCYYCDEPATHAGSYIASCRACLEIAKDQGNHLVPLPSTRIEELEAKVKSLDQENDRLAEALHGLRRIHFGCECWCLGWAGPFDDYGPQHSKACLAVQTALEISVDRP